MTRGLGGPLAHSPSRDPCSLVSGCTCPFGNPLGGIRFGNPQDPVYKATHSRIFSPIWPKPSPCKFPQVRAYHTVVAKIWSAELVGLSGEGEEDTLFCLPGFLPGCLRVLGQCKPTLPVRPDSGSQSELSDLHIAHR